MISPNYQAKLSGLVGSREGNCLNVMDAEAHALQAQHRNRYAGVSTAPMFTGRANGLRGFTAVPTRAY